jgi:hypothetical protein
MKGRRGREACRQSSAGVSSPLRSPRPFSACPERPERREGDRTGDLSGLRFFFFQQPRLLEPFWRNPNLKFRAALPSTCTGVTFTFMRSNYTRECEAFLHYCPHQGRHEVHMYPLPPLRLHLRVRSAQRQPAHAGGDCDQPPRRQGASRASNDYVA